MLYVPLYVLVCLLGYLELWLEEEMTILLLKLLSRFLKRLHKILRTIRMSERMMSFVLWGKVLEKQSAKL